MTIRGMVLDGDTGDELQGASIVIADKDGKYLGEGVLSGQDGSFALTSAKLEGNKVLISFAGYNPLLVDAATLAQPFAIPVALSPNYGDLATVYVTPGKTNYAAVLAILLGLTGAGMALAIK